MMKDDNDLSDIFGKKPAKELNIKSWQDLEVFAARTLPFIQLFMMAGGENIIREKVRTEYNKIAQLDAQYLEQAAVAIKLGSFSSVTSLKSSSLNKGHEEMVASARVFQDALKTLGEDRYTAAVKAIYDVLPRRLKGFTDEVQGVSPADVEDKIRQSYRDSLSKTPEEQVASRIDIATHEAHTADFLNALINKLDGQSLSTLMQHFTTAVSADDAADTAVKGARFGEELLSNIATGRSMDSSRTGSFLSSLKDRLEAAEDALVAANVLPDASAIKAALIAGNQKKKQNKGPETPQP